jgi:hypothetical protein
MRLLIIVGVLMFLALTANAHHATTTNFTQELITVEGVIEQVRYQNPHSSILIKITSADGEQKYWLIETGAKTTLQRKGVNLDRLVVGEKIRATGLKGRRQYTMFLHEIVFEDGSVFTTKGLTK